MKKGENDWLNKRLSSHHNIVPMDDLVIVFSLDCNLCDICGTNTQEVPENDLFCIKGKEQCFLSDW